MEAVYLKFSLYHLWLMEERSAGFGLVQYAEHSQHQCCDVTMKPRKQRFKIFSPWD